MILGSLTFQQHPAPLILDGTAMLFRDLKKRLDNLPDVQSRMACFQDYMSVHFSLLTPEDAGFSPNSALDRANATYLRLLRGWFFDTDGRDAAVLRGWVESRFGLLPRYHAGVIVDGHCANYRRYLHARTSGLYNTNALESQLDMLYTWCQYEIHRSIPEQRHVTLFRGINSRDSLEYLDRDREMPIAVLNNLSSFSSDVQRAGELGAYVIEVKVPREKILLYPALTTGFLNSEQEYLVIGGVYEIRLLKLPLL